VAKGRHWAQGSRDFRSSFCGVSREGIALLLAVRCFVLGLRSGGSTRSDGQLKNHRSLLSVSWHWLLNVMVMVAILLVLELSLLPLQKG